MSKLTTFVLEFQPDDQAAPIERDYHCANRAAAEKAGKSIAAENFMTFLRAYPKTEKKV